MLNFSVGPVQAFDYTKERATEELLYFRTQKFCELTLETERMLLKLIDAPKNARALFLTASGTGAMEAVVLNTLTQNDKALLVNGGEFSSRFASMLTLHQIPFTPIQVDRSTALTCRDLEPYENAGYTAFIVNVVETSVGVLYDLNLIEDFCTRNNLFLITDVVSSFLADPFSMRDVKSDCAIMASQKGLALPPGLAPVVLSKRAQERASQNTVNSFYFNFSEMLDRGLSGQTPFTPAVATLMLLHERLKHIISAGGVQPELDRCAKTAQYFRKHAQNLPLKIHCEHPSNAVTFIEVKENCASEIFETLQKKYGICVCTNPKPYNDSFLRVGHLGNITQKNNEYLIDSLQNLFETCPQLALD